jgi:hypothetical protein
MPEDWKLIDYVMMPVSWGQATVSNYCILFYYSILTFNIQ